VAVPLLGGWVLGILLWSTMIPPQIVSAAEEAAGDRSYCIDVDGQPALGARDLTGLSVHARNDAGWSWNFHALLVIGPAAERSYMNWSYRSGRFEPVKDSTRTGLHLDQQAKCTPKAHFARDWISR
jgi:hypothetical protein